jgi:hypothetical protein
MRESIFGMESRGWEEWREIGGLTAVSRNGNWKAAGWRIPEMGAFGGVTKFREDGHPGSLRGSSRNLGQWSTNLDFLPKVAKLAVYSASKMLELKPDEIPPTPATLYACSDDSGHHRLHQPEP